MRTEHKRPLVAFIVVALFCSFTVGNAVRSAILGNGFGLTILIPMAPPNLIRTIEASGSNGRYLDTPFLGTAISAVSDAPAPAAPEPGPTAPQAGTAVVPVVATPTRPAVRTPAPRPAGHHAGVQHHPRSHDIGEAPVTSVGPTALAEARTDLRAALTYASRARQAVKNARFDARWCVAEKGRAACQDQIVAVETARIRADAAAAQADHLGAVVDHLRGEISTLVAPVREKATRTFGTRVERAKEKFVEVRVEVRSQSQAFHEARQDAWADAVAAYARAVDQAGRAAHAASDQRLRQVHAYAKKRQATVRNIQHVYEQKVRAGHAAAARAYRKRAYANLAKRDHAFDVAIIASRERAAAAYETAIGAAKSTLDRTRAEAAIAKQEHDAEVAAALARAIDAYRTKVQTAAELRAETIATALEQATATVVVDPATVPVDAGQVATPGE